MSDGRVKIVRQLYEAWASGDFRAGADLLDEHVVFVVGGDFPEFGVAVGPAEVGNYMRRFLQHWERYSVEAKQVAAVGDTVVAQCLQHGSGKESGVEVEDPFFMLFTFRGSKILRIDSVRSEPEVLEAVGDSYREAQADS